MNLSPIMIRLASTHGSSSALRLRARAAQAPGVTVAGGLAIIVQIRRMLRSLRVLTLAGALRGMEGNWYSTFTASGIQRRSQRTTRQAATVHRQVLASEASAPGI